MRSRARAMCARAVDLLPPSAGVGIRARWGGSRDPEIAHLHRLVRAGDSVLDVGAHKGVYTWHLARLVGPAGVVYAFEPQPDLARYLRSAFSRKPQVEVWPCALSDRTGTATMHIPLWGRRLMRGHGTLTETRQGVELPVELHRLDDLPIRSPSFIKADVEGHELMLLTGGLESLRVNMPTLLLEIDRRHPDMDGTHTRLASLLTELGYRCFVVGVNARLVEVTPDFGNRHIVADALSAAPYNYFFLSDATARKMAD